MATRKPVPTDDPTQIHAMPAPAEDHDLGDLESLDSDDYGSVTWYIYRLRDDENGSGPLSSNGRFCAKIVGALDLERLRSLVGGGRFRVFGRGSRGSGIGPIRRVVEIEGPPKLAPLAETQDDQDDQDDRGDWRIDQLAEQVAKLTAMMQAQAQPAPNAGLGITNLRDLIELTRQLAPPPPTEPVIAALTRGIEIGRETTETEGDGLAGMVKAFAPALIAMLKTSPPAGGAYATAPAKAPTLPAKPVEPAGTTAPTPPTPSALPAPISEATQVPAQDNGFTMLSMIVTRGLAMNTTPSDLAVTLLDLLTDDQARMLVSLGSDQLIQLAKSQGIDKVVPGLNDAKLPAYLSLVLSEIEADFTAQGE
jgi:hypothetical protein